MNRVALRMRVGVCSPAKKKLKMASLIHILYLEDDPMDAELVQARLEEAGLACRVTRIQTRDEFEQALGQDTLDIILADYRLPMYDGLSALQRVLERRPDVPLIFVSGTMGEEAAIESLTRGATDYVLKQNLSRLPSAVQRALQEAQSRRERKLAEKALAEGEAKMRGILDSVDEGFIVIDRGYRILSANKAFCNLVDLHEEQVIGGLCHEISYQSARPCFESGEECPVKRTFETGTAHVASHTHEDKSGAQQHLELKSYPLVDASGTIASAIKTVNDVTETRKLQEQLTQSLKMESVGRLAGGVAHDFNNMLGVIIGHTELAMELVDPPHPILANLGEILDAAERSAKLTRQLLGFARKQLVTPRVLDLNKTVAGMLEMLRPMIGEDIDLVWRPGDGVWPVKMDPSQIDQILANLCVNARDAISGIGRIIIETGMTTFDSAYCAQHPEFVLGEYVSLTVSDDGCGMDHETLGHIFDPFFTTKAVGSGTGLGLATIYGIAKQNDGFIHAYSKPGQGTTFKLCLPRHAAETVEAQPRAHAAPAPGGHETILLAEDEPSIREMVKMMLEKLGYRVLTASTPGEVIRLANAHEGEIHLLLVDVIMPEMNGRDLAKQVVSLYPEMVCLFMSGYTGDVLAHHGMLAEGVNFIQKPFSMQDLAAKVREDLDAD
jgi:two-component system, cell cycle sensor histidine kinase and response regulator CckA